MKKRASIFFLAAVLLLAAGCRVREISDPALADTVIETSQSVPELPEEPEEIPDEPEPDTSQEPEEPQEHPEPEESQEPEPEEDEAAEDTRPDRAGTVSSAGAEMLHETVILGVTVTYDSNGGESGTVSTSVKPESPYGPQPDAIRRGYTFEGWYTRADGGERVTSETIVTETSDHTLYAHWRIREASVVTFDANGGRIKSSAARLEISEGDLFGELPVPIRDGYDLDGWFTQPEDGEQILETDVFGGEDSLTLYAHWIYNPYKFWSFTLKNRTQQIYMCQQVGIYYEGETEHSTDKTCPLVSPTGSLNIAENRDDPNVTDDWVKAKKPDVVLKCVASIGDAPSAYSSMSARFPDQKIIIVTSDAVRGDSSTVLLSQLTLAKELYPDWYDDVDLSLAAQELDVTVESVYII